MIWESRFWKEDLLRAAARIAKRTKQLRWPDRSYVNLEKDIFISCYSIRKLLDNHKLSDRVRGMSIPVTRYAASGKTVTLLNWHNIERLYDLDSEKKASLGLRKFCDQIIHSYVFITLHEEGAGLRGLLFVSDKERNRHLYEVAARDLVNIFVKVGEDTTHASNLRYDESLGDYKVSQY